MDMLMVCLRVHVDLTLYAHLVLLLLVFFSPRPNELDPKGTTDVILHIKRDNYTELEKIGHIQYFCFRATVSGLTKTHKVKYILENAEASSYPEAWFGE